MEELEMVDGECLDVREVDRLPNWVQEVLENLLEEVVRSVDEKEVEKQLVIISDDLDLPIIISDDSQ